MATTVWKERAKRAELWKRHVQGFARRLAMLAEKGHRFAGCLEMECICEMGPLQAGLMQIARDRLFD